MRAFQRRARRLFAADAIGQEDFTNTTSLGATFRPVFVDPEAGDACFQRRARRLSRPMPLVKTTY